MKPEEFKAFSRMLSDVADYYGKPLAPAGIQIYWNALAAFDLPIVRTLLNEHVQTNKFMPAVSELLDQLKARDGRPGPEEAWGMIPLDEAGSVVWTEEMAEAFGVARHLIADGDRIVARMAFLESYRALVREARNAGVPVRWTPSLGHDVTGRERVLIEAQRAGRLSREHVAGLLPHRAEPSPEIMALLPDMSAEAGPRRSLTEALAEARAAKNAERKDEAA